MTKGIPETDQPNLDGHVYADFPASGGLQISIARVSAWQVFGLIGSLQMVAERLHIQEMMDSQEAHKQSGLVAVRGSIPDGLKM